MYNDRGWHRENIKPLEKREGENGRPIVNEFSFSFSQPMAAPVVMMRSAQEPCSQGHFRRHNGRGGRSKVLPFSRRPSLSTPFSYGNNGGDLYGNNVMLQICFEKQSDSFQ